MAQHRLRGIILLAAFVGACGAGPDVPAGAGDTAETAAPAGNTAAEPANTGSVTFDVELIGGEHAGRYELSTDDRCMAIAGANGQLNVNAFSDDVALRYAQVSIYDFEDGGGTSDRLIFIAQTEPYELRLDTNPDSIVGISGTGSVTWEVDDSRNIVVRVEGEGDDGVEVRATITCSGPSWTG